MAIPFQTTASSLLALLRFPVRYPGTAVEIAPGEVSAVLVREDRGGPRLAGYGIAPFEGHDFHAVSGPPKAEAVQELRRALGAAVRAAGIKPGKASLIIPDSAVRVWLLQLPEIPRAHQATLEMIRWKIKRSVPFKIEDGTITWQVLSRPSGGQPGVLLVGLLPRATIAQYESLMLGEGLKVGLVDLSSFNIYNILRRLAGVNSSTPGDFACINATKGYFTLMIFRRGEMIFYRCKSHPTGEGAAPDDRAKMFRRELAASLSYYTEKLKGVSLSRTVGRIADPDLPEATEILAALGFAPLEPFDPSKVARLPANFDAPTALTLLPALGAALGRNA